ncbi:hypothetical protein RJT34_30193 [Clitoria ternatea]|uniref:Uncharacterized protein n=1 Tax=Clitoria ternatea TaxID=43366 RepID=A0AAN9ESV6_CLITE
MTIFSLLLPLNARVHRFFKLIKSSLHNSELWYYLGEKETWESVPFGCTIFVRDMFVAFFDGMWVLEMFPEKAWQKLKTPVVNDSDEDGEEVGSC